MIIRLQTLKENIVIALTFILGLMLTILPLPSWATWYRPAWVLLILIFWLLAVPHRLGIATAWCIGLFMDLLTGTQLGLHALFFTLLAYLIVKFHLALRGMSSGQKFLLIFVLETVYLATHYWVMSDESSSSLTWLYWLPVFTTTLCWPWVSMLLKDYQRRFGLK